MRKKKNNGGDLVSKLEALRKAVVKNDMHSFTDFKLVDIVNIPALQKLMDIRNLPIGIMDEDNRILVAVAWQDVCVNFHRVCPISAKRCLESDAYVKKYLNPDHFISYHCGNGMWDIAIPIVIENQHVGTIFIGQFFYDDDNIDYDYFKRQCDELGFNWQEYKEALDKVPRFSKKQVENFMEFNRQIVHLMAEQGIANLKLKREMEERKKAETQLDFQLLIMGTLLENLPMGVIMIEAGTGKTLIENKEARKLFERDILPEMKENNINRREIALKRSTGELYPPEEMPIIQGLRGIYGHIDDMMIKRPDGSTILIEVYGSPIKNKDGEIIASLSFFFDITERKRAEEERLELERQILHAQKLESLGVLAGGIAHDFNNLLTAVLGHTSLALMDLPSLSPARSDIEEIEKATRRAADLAKQMLAYSGKGHFVIQDICINDMLIEMSHLISVSVSKNITLIYTLSKDDLYIQGDATQIRQIILNLITNASDAIGKEQGTIVISSGVIMCDKEYLQTYNPAYRPGIDPDLPEKNYVYFEVTDSGEGMDKEIMEKIFDPFFSTKFTGRGLGLAAVLGIVRGHNGAIKITSAKGGGTTFRILLPFQDSAYPDKSTVSGKETIPLGTGSGTILIADDEAFVRQIISKILERNGYNVMLADNGEEAVKLFQNSTESITLVILDMTMPKMDGEMTFREIRKIRPEIPVILISGYSEQEVAKKFEGLNLDGFLHKPFSYSDLIQKIRDTLNKPGL